MRHMRKDFELDSIEKKLFGDIYLFGHMEVIVFHFLDLVDTLNLLFMLSIFRSPFLF